MPSTESLTTFATETHKLWLKDVGRAHSQKVKQQSFAPFLNASAPQPPFLCSTRRPPTFLRRSACSFTGESRGLRGTCPLRQMSTLASGGNLSQRQVGAEWGGVSASGQVHQHVGGGGVCALDGVCRGIPLASGYLIHASSLSPCVVEKEMRKHLVSHHRNLIMSKT